MFRHRALALEFVRGLRADTTEGPVTVVIEERTVATTAWRPVREEGRP